MALTRTGIEYFRNAEGKKGYCWNFYEGCLNSKEVCPVRDACWARQCARMGRLTDKEFKPHLLAERLLDPLKGYNPKKPRRIGVCFTGDLGGDWVSPELQSGDRLEIPPCPAFPRGWLMLNTFLLSRIFTMINACPADTFIFLTKRPENLIKWSPFPQNCYVGVSVTNQDDADGKIPELLKIEATVRFVSIEPMLGKVDISSYVPGWNNAGTTFENPELFERYDLDWSPVNPINWVIIGQQTPVSKKTTPKIEWIKEIVDAADKAGVAVFLKDNLEVLLLNSDSNWAFERPKSEFWFLSNLRQEYPKCQKEV